MPLDVVRQAAAAASQLDPAVSERVEAIVSTIEDFAAHDPDFTLDQVEEGRLPFFKATAGEELREERRVCFVGVCRAEELLILARVRSDRGYVQHPSRFLGEMGL